MEYGQTHTGMWHKIGDLHMDGKRLPQCQSYNLDRPNFISGDVHSAIPADVRRCKKCFSSHEGEE